MPLQTPNLAASTEPDLNFDTTKKQLHRWWLNRQGQALRSLSVETEIVLWP